MTSTAFKEPVQKELDGQFVKRAVAGAGLGIWDANLASKELTVSDEMIELLGFV